MSDKSVSSDSIIIENYLSESMSALAVPVAFRFGDDPTRFIVKSRTADHSPSTQTIIFTVKYEGQMLEP